MSKVQYLRTFEVKLWSKKFDLFNNGDALPADLLSHEIFKRDFKTQNNTLSVWKLEDDRFIDPIMTRMAVSGNGVEGKGYVLFNQEELDGFVLSEGHPDPSFGFSYADLHIDIDRLSVSDLLRFIDLVCPKICEVVRGGGLARDQDWLRKLGGYLGEGIFQESQLPQAVKTMLREL